MKSKLVQGDVKRIEVFLEEVEEPMVRTPKLWKRRW